MASYRSSNRSGSELRGDRGQCRIVPDRHAAAALIGIAENAEPFIKELLKRTPDVVTSIQRELPDGFPQNVLDKIESGLTDSSRRLAATLPKGVIG